MKRGERVEPYLFGLRSRSRTRTQTRTKSREIRRWWTLGLLYRQVESAHELRRPQFGYRYEDEEWLVVDGTGKLLVRSQGTSWCLPAFVETRCD